MIKEEEAINCPVCDRITPRKYWHKHHLIPRSKKGSKKGTVKCCISCGKMVHKLFSNKDLAKKYDTVEKLLSHPDVQKWVEWIKRKPNDFSVCMAAKKKKR